MENIKRAALPYQERVAYNASGLPIYVNEAHLFDYSSKGHPCHYHSDVEFLYIRSGRMTYFINGQLCRMKAGEGIFVNSQHLHNGFSEDGTDGDFFCIVLNPMLLAVLPQIEQDYVRPLLENKAFVYQHLRPEISWQSQVLELLRAVYDRKDQPLEEMAAVYRIWQLLFENMPRGEGPNRRQEDARLNTMRLMVSYIQSNLTEKVTLAAVANAGHVCQSTCCRLFQQYLNRSPMAYLNECRLSRACELLRETTLSVTEIANRTGFSGPSYFTEQFRSLYGCTPSQYRKK